MAIPNVYQEVAKLQKQVAALDARVLALSIMEAGRANSFQAQLSEVLRLLQEDLGIDQDTLSAVTPNPAEGIFFIVDGQEIKKMDLKVSQKVTLSIAIQDKGSNPAQVEGAPAWSVTDPSLADIVAAADGMSAELTPKGQLGAFNVQVSADADLGAGVKQIAGELPVNLLAGDAVSISIAAGTPSDI